MNLFNWEKSLSKMLIFAQLLFHYLGEIRGSMPALRIVSVILEISWNVYRPERATSHLGGVFLSLPVNWLTLISISSMCRLSAPDTNNSILEFHLCSTSTQNSASLWLTMNKFCTIYIKTYREKGPLPIRSWLHIYCILCGMLGSAKFPGKPKYIY